MESPTGWNSLKFHRAINAAQIILIGFRYIYTIQKLTKRADIKNITNVLSLALGELERDTIQLIAMAKLVELCERKGDTAEGETNDSIFTNYVNAKVRLTSSLADYIQAFDDFDSIIRIVHEKLEEIDAIVRLNGLIDHNSKLTIDFLEVTKSHLGAAISASQELSSSMNHGGVSSTAENWPTEKSLVSDDDSFYLNVINSISSWKSDLSFISSQIHQSIPSNIIDAVIRYVSTIRFANELPHTELNGTKKREVAEKTKSAKDLNDEDWVEF